MPEYLEDESCCFAPEGFGRHHIEHRRGDEGFDVGVRVCDHPLMPCPTCGEPQRYLCDRYGADTTQPVFCAACEDGLTD